MERIWIDFKYFKVWEDSSQDAGEYCSKQDKEDEGINHLVFVVNVEF